MDILLMEELLKDTLVALTLRIQPGEREASFRLGQVLADGLMRYLILSSRPECEKLEDFDLLLESVEFWAGLHGYPKRKQPQKQNGLVRATRAANAAG